MMNIPVEEDTFEYAPGLSTMCSPPAVINGSSLLIKEHLGHTERDSSPPHLVALCARGPGDINKKSQALFISVPSALQGNEGCSQLSTLSTHTHIPHTHIHSIPPNP